MDFLTIDNQLGIMRTTLNSGIYLISPMGGFMICYFKVRNHISLLPLPQQLKDVLTYLDLTLIHRHQGRHHRHNYQNQQNGQNNWNSNNDNI
jgi:hypothetical protein